jgi:hypothetical protein
MGWGHSMVKDEVEHTTSSNVEVWVVEKMMLHVRFVQFAVYLCPGSLNVAL